jgi:hypothetical protein
MRRLIARRIVDKRVDGRLSGRPFFLVAAREDG